MTVGETFSITVPLFVLLMSIIGGARHWLGPAIGAVFVTSLTNSLVSGDWALAARALIGFALIAATLYLPEGVIGLIEKTWRGRKPVPAPAAAAAPSTSHEAAAAPAPRKIGAPLLHCEDVHLAFRGVRALNGVTLEVREGEILGLVGPNGSGKSTLINVVSGLYRPDAGRLKFAGEDVTGDDGHRRARRGIARTFQIPRPFRRLSVLDNTVVAGQFGGRGLDHSSAIAQARQWLAFVGLEARAHALPAELNLHQRKFLELARALAAGARLIMLDEVLAGLTPAEITTAVEMVRKIHRSGATIIFVEHNMRAVLALADRLVVLNQGQIIAEGDPRAVMNDAAVVSAYLGDADAEH